MEKEVVVEVIKNEGGSKGEQRLLNKTFTLQMQYAIFILFLYYLYSSKYLDLTSLIIPSLFF